MQTPASDPGSLLYHWLVKHVPVELGPTQAPKTFGSFQKSGGGLVLSSHQGSYYPGSILGAVDFWKLLCRESTRPQHHVGEFLTGLFESLHTGRGRTKADATRPASSIFSSPEAMSKDSQDFCARLCPDLRVQDCCEVHGACVID